MGCWDRVLGPQTSQQGGGDCEEMGRALAMGLRIVFWGMREAKPQPAAHLEASRSKLGCVGGHLLSLSQQRVKHVARALSAAGERGQMDPQGSHLVLLTYWIPFQKTQSWPGRGNTGCPVDPHLL